MEKNINYHFTRILLMKISHLSSCYIHSSEIQFFQMVCFKISWRKTRKNYKGELLNVLCFLNIASVLGHVVVHITSAALSIYSNCAGMFLIKLKRLKRPSRDLPRYQKKVVPRRLSCKYIRIFSVSSTRPNVSSLFRKIVTLFKRWHTIDFFSQNILFKAANFRDMLHKYMRYMSYSLHSVGV